MTVVTPRSLESGPLHTLGEDMKPNGQDSRRKTCGGTPVSWLCAVATIAMAGVAEAQDPLPAGWVSLDGGGQVGMPSVQTVPAGPGTFALDIAIPGFSAGDESALGMTYRRLSLHGAYQTEAVGHPCLPEISQLVALPAGCEVAIQASPRDSVIFSDVTLWPTSAPVIKYTDEGWPYGDYDFVLDDGAYARPGYYPAEIAGIDRMGSFRGQGVGRLRVHPIQYDPVARRVRAFRSVRVELTITGGVGGTTPDLGPLASIAEGVLANYESPVAFRSRGAGEPGAYGHCHSVAQCESLQTDYLMIVQRDLLGPGTPLVDSLAAHRAEFNGYNVAIVSDSTIAAGASISDELIRGFIQDLYETGSAEHMGDSKLGYVLLVGDAREAGDSLLPAHEADESIATGVDHVTTDHWYACVEGNDWYPDLLLGRLCADEVPELRTEVAKYIDYEVEASLSDAWRDSILLSCGFACTQDASMQASTDTHFVYVRATMESLSYGIREVHAHEQPGSDCDDQVLSARTPNRREVNAGRHVVEFCVHGWPAGMQTFYYRDADSLSNAGHAPFWMSYSCGTGKLDAFVGWVEPGYYGGYDCLGEHLMHGNGQNGAIGYFGSSEPSFPDA